MEGMMRTRFLHAARLLVAWTAVLISSVGAAAQIPEYDFYSDFRAWAQALRAAERPSRDQVLERYKQKLTNEGVAAPEIERRLTLLETKRDALEADFWNRFFTRPNAGFNTEPNSFLVSVAEHRKPGRALDVGIGEGRNSLYLAKLGWDVTGVDPADKAVALAKARASKLGVKIHTVIALDRDFDFGQDQWDLILYSWVIPSTVDRVVTGLRRGGVLVLEGSREWYDFNGLLELFKPLRVLRYEDEYAPSDYFKRKPMDVVRLLAEKPAEER
jgi:SAM-dependent methyltransferase